MTFSTLRPPTANKPRSERRPAFADMFGQTTGTWCSLSQTTLQHFCYQGSQLSDLPPELSKHLQPRCVPQAPESTQLSLLLLYKPTAPHHHTATRTRTRKDAHFMRCFAPPRGWIPVPPGSAFTPGLRWAWLNPQTSGTSPGVGRLVSELRGHQGKVLPNPEPQVGFGDAAVVRVDGVDTGHLPGDQPERKHKH